MKPNSDVEEFVEDFLRVADKLEPQIERSAFVLALLDKRPDIYLALQLGLALTLDKPIIVIAPHGAYVAPRLRAIADAVIDGPGGLADGALRERTQAAIVELIKKQRPQ